MKQTIRQTMRARRKALSDAARQAASAIICFKLLADDAVHDRLHPPAGRGVVAVYLASPQEIDLTPFIRQVMADGVTVVAPRWNGTVYELSVVKGLAADDLRQGPMGIWEPDETAERVAPRAVDVWLVPGLAFTRDGGRLGYGGGWYDRLMADAAATALKIGVAYTFQIVDALPSEPHDIRLTGVVDDGAAG